MTLKMPPPRQLVDADEEEDWVAVGAQARCTTCSCRAALRIRLRSSRPRVRAELHGVSARRPLLGGDGSRHHLPVLHRPHSPAPSSVFEPHAPSDCSVVQPHARADLSFCQLRLVHQGVVRHGFLGAAEDVVPWARTLPVCLRGEVENSSFIHRFLLPSHFSRWIAGARSKTLPGSQGPALHLEPSRTMVDSTLWIWRPTPMHLFASKRRACVKRNAPVRESSCAISCVSFLLNATFTASSTAGYQDCADSACLSPRLSHRPGGRRQVSVFDCIQFMHPSCA